MIRVGDDLLSHQHHMLGITSVHHRVAQGAALGTSRGTVRVAVLVTGRDPDEGHRGSQLAGLHQGCPATVGVDLDRVGEQTAGGDPPGQVAAHPGGVDPGDHTALDIADQAGMAVAGQGEVTPAQCRQGLHHLQHDLVALAEVVVEADGVAVGEAAPQRCLLDRPDQLAPSLGGGVGQVRRPGSPPLVRLEPGQGLVIGRNPRHRALLVSTGHRTPPPAAEAAER